MPPRRLDEDQVRRIAAEFERGATRGEIAEAFGVHASTITRALKACGAESVRGARRKLSSSDQAEIVSDYGRGGSISELAERFGITRQYVSQIAISGGAAPRRPNQPGRARCFGDPDIAVGDFPPFSGRERPRQLGRDHRVAHTTVRTGLFSAGGVRGAGHAPPPHQTPRDSLRAAPTRGAGGCEQPFRNGFNPSTSRRRDSPSLTPIFEPRP